MTAEALGAAPARAAELDDLTLRRAQGGDPAAFRALVERYQRPIWELCWRMVAPAGLGLSLANGGRDGQPCRATLSMITPGMGQMSDSVRHRA